MTGHFEISPYMSFRWVDNNVTSPYNTLPLESRVDELSFAQTIQCGGGGYQSDTGQIQLTSDFIPTCGLYTYDNVFIKAVSLTAINPPILGVSFICYNGTIDFSDVAPGWCYAKITYTDDDLVDHDWRTSPLDVEIFHDETQLIEATNFDNDKGVVFVNPDLSTIVINFRVSSIIRQPLVKSDAQDYEDQYNDLDQLTSIPFVIYTQCIGGPTLLPFWVIEKINLLYSLDQVLIDGNPFAKLSGADFKPTRAEVFPQGAWWEVDIQPNFNYPSEQFITGTPTDGGNYIVIKQQRTFTAQSADFAFTGNFNIGKNLIRLAVKNTGLDIFILKVGNADGDNSFGEFDIPAQLDNSLDIGKYFTTPTDVWISGITGTNLDITFDWNDYRAVNTPPGPTSQLFAKNTIYYFQEVTPGSFAVEFDVATGLGNVGTDHEGCVLAGTNGTPSVTGLLVRGWDNTEVLPANTRGTVIGDNQHVQTINEMPEHTFNTVNGDVHGAGGGGDIAPGQALIRKWSAGINTDYNLQGSGTVPDRGITNPLGNGDPMDITNEAVILPAFYFIG